MPGSGKRHPGNTLNDLTGKEWLQFTRSWFTADSKRYHRNKGTELHPARYPEEMVESFIRFFTKAGEWVLDPFLGSGATLVSCAETGRNGVGLELNPRYAAVARERIAALHWPSGTGGWVLQADARRLTWPALWSSVPLAGCRRNPAGLPQFDFVMTSPPYWNMLRTSRGGVKSNHQQRAESGLDTFYSDDPADLGNIADYGLFLETLSEILGAAAALLRPGRYLVAVVQNLRTPDGEIKTLAWDLARRLERHPALRFQGERIWCQNTKPLGIWGYPKLFVPNYHHHYCLIFRQTADPESP
jgi:SAM-dependent methyltransferase